MARSSPAGRKVSLKRVLAGLALICLGSLSLVSIGASGAGAVPNGGNTGGGNEDCPTGTNLIAKFEWNGEGYVFEKPDENEALVTIADTSTASAGTWTSTVDIGYVIVKGGSGVKDGTNATTVTVPDDPRSGSFSNDGLDNAEGEEVREPDISNVQFCDGTEVLSWDLTVTKSVSDGTDNSSAGDNFAFTVSCGTYQLATGDAAFSLGHGGTKTISGIPDGTSCTVSESASGWSTTINGTADADQSTAVVMDQDRTAAFANSRSGSSPTFRSLTVTKAVSDGTDNSSAGDTFSFSVSCTNHTLAAGDAAFSLGDAGSKTINNIPDGSSCTIAESASGWSTTIDGSADADQSTTAVMNQDRTVAFANSRSAPDVEPEAFSYECSAASDVTATSATLNGDTDDPDASVASFTLTGNGEEQVETDANGNNGWSVAVTGLEPETQYFYQVHWGAGKASVNTCSFTTLEGAEVLPETEEKTPPKVLGEVFTKPKVAPAVLARTGSTTTPLVALAAALILLGIAMLVPFRRREAAQA